MQQVTLSEAVAQLPHLIAAAMRGEEILIAGDHSEIVQLIPVASAKKKSRLWERERYFQDGG